MIRGLYTSAVGMINQMKRMDVVANNLANTDSLGFNRDLLISESFQDVLGRSVRDHELRGRNVANSIMGPISLGIFTSTIHRDFSPGPLQQTGGTLDLSLDSAGFFTILFDDGAEGAVMLTRDGSFMVDDAGMLITREGFAVLDQDGAPIFLPVPLGAEVNIAQNGAIFSDGAYIATLGLTNVENTESLRPFGHNLLAATEETEFAAFGGFLLQGFLEGSNVNPVREMVEMISLTRVYEANQRMISMQDQTLGQAVSEIARQ